MAPHLPGNSTPGPTEHGRDCGHATFPESHEPLRKGAYWSVDNLYFTCLPANYRRPTCASAPPSPFWGAGCKDTTVQVTMKGRQPCGSSQKASFSPFLPQSHFCRARKRQQHICHFQHAHFSHFRQFLPDVGNPSPSEVRSPLLPTNYTAGLPLGVAIIF